MSFLIQTLQDKDLAPNVPILETVQDEVSWSWGPYPAGFAPPAFFEAGSVVSANNQRPAAWPGGAFAPISLCTPYLPKPIDSDTRFLAKPSYALPETVYWKTNSELQAEMDTYADGVHKNKMVDPVNPNRRAQVMNQYNYLIKEAGMYKKAADEAKAQVARAEGDQAGVYMDEYKQDMAQAEARINEARQLMATFNINPMNGQQIAQANQGSVFASEGETASKYAYGVAPPFAAPYTFGAPTAYDQRRQQTGYGANALEGMVVGDPGYVAP